MLAYNREEATIRKVKEREVYCFQPSSGNIDVETVKSFGDEWLKFDTFSEEEIKTAGDQYFDIVNEEILHKDAVVLDLGCGSGRWTRYMANKVKFIEAVDPSDAIFRAAASWEEMKNVRFTQAAVDTIPFEDNSFDLAISLGVLHHIPDTSEALRTLLKKVKPGGHALIYLYYALDNRGSLYKFLFHTSTFFRRIIAGLPKGLKHGICDIIALTIYLPLVLLSRLIKVIVPGNTYKKVPLSYYIDKSWNIIRNDALDRFGTPLEQRFTKEEIRLMLSSAGMENILFSEGEPYWHVLAQKKGE
jgi:SAM-dependent methyltransferase